ncbi:FAD-binding oxidoreductase [Allohahella marinimesophila]|uniref:FAD-binding oxidoreductase n=1 Tax=Allohahella marinimesophila TaxID=1054972 RepID=A0ABP7PST2_9GAMM
MTTLEHAAIDTFRGELGGPVFEPTDDGYNEARQIWNAMIDRKPALIARCLSADDVVAAVNFGREQSMLISVRGGGHNIAGNAVCDDGLMIDLSYMKDIDINVENQRAYVGPGCRLADFDAAAQAHGLATPLGINSTTGVAGLTLGGGFGWLSRKFGMTVDNLISVDMVTADGRQRHASATENADLFWGTRGGDGNFGIVTRFEFKLHPVGPELLSGLIVFPFDQARAVLTQFARFTENMPDELNVWLVMRQAPPLPFLPESVHGKRIVALAICYAGDPEEGEKLIAPLRSFGDAHGEHVGVQPYVDWQQAFDPLLADGARNYWKSHNFVKLTDDVIRVALEYGEKLASPHCEIFIASIGGQTGRVAEDAMAYSSRDANYVMNVHGRWDTSGEDDHCRQWARAFFEAAKPYASGGAYINFLSNDETDRVEFAYGAAYKRLVEIKQKYDPENLFRVNQNIRPY